MRPCSVKLASSVATLTSSNIFIFFYNIESPLPPYSELAMSEEEDLHTQTPIPTHIELPQTPPHTPLMTYKELGSTCSSASYSTSSSSSSTSSSISGNYILITN